MSRPSSYTRVLDLYIAARRLGPLAWLTAALALGIVVMQVRLLPELRLQRSALANQLEAMRRAGHATPAASVPQVSTNAQRVGDFERTLGDRDHQEELIRAMFASARQSELVLAEGEYAAAVDKAGMFETLEVSQPVHGSYRQVRAYCERTLSTLPFAALDALQFKREGVAAATGEARIQWTLYLRTTQPAELNPRERP